MSQPSPPPLAVSQEALNLEKQGLRVEFHWTGDRFSHTILDLHEGQAIPLLKSIEGSPEESFPASPPLVELHQQDKTIFLTGATHAGHWSMSVEPVRFGEGSGFLFDVACRIKSLPEGLTSSYQRVKGDFRLEPLPLPDAEEQPSCQLTFTENQVQLIGHTKEGHALPMTVRWRYQLIAVRKPEFQRLIADS